jgi:hypothetical protein
MGFPPIAPAGATEICIDVDAGISMASVESEMRGCNNEVSKTEG